MKHRPIRKCRDCQAQAEVIATGRDGRMQWWSCSACLEGAQTTSTMTYEAFFCALDEWIEDRRATALALAAARLLVPHCSVCIEPIDLSTLAATPGKDPVCAECEAKYRVRVAKSEVP